MVDTVITALPIVGRPVAEDADFIAAVAAHLVGAQLVNNQTGTTYTLAASDAGKKVTFSNASPVTVTVDDDQIAWQDGHWVLLVNKGAGAVTIQAGGVSPVTINAQSAQTKVLEQYGAATLLFEGGAVATLAGGMTPA